MNTIKNTFLSNFWECNVEYAGLRFNNSEAAFQAQKCANESDKEKFVGLTGAEAKALGKKVLLEEYWDINRLGAMHEVVMAKFKQNHDLAKLLFATYPEEIVEDNTWGDRYWGVCNGVGENNLGKILMQVRYRLMDDRMQPCPEECPSFMGGSCACSNDCECCGPGLYDCPECGWVTECYPSCPIK